jgi:DNA-binding beta-propeller fold protein YncE
MNRQLTIAALVLFCLAPARGDEVPTSLMKLVQTIQLEGVEGRIDHMAIDPHRHRLYVAALENNTLEVIDLEAGKRLKSIAGLKKPAGVRVVPKSGEVIVASGQDGKVRVFDADLKLRGTIDGLDDADNVRLDDEGKLAYVGYGDGAIAIIDPARLAKVGEIKLAGHPESFQLDEHGPRIFVNVPSAGHIAVLDREKKAMIAKWPIEQERANFPMALDEANHRLLVACRKPAKVLVLESESGKTLTSLDCCGDADDLFWDADSGRVYVSGGEGCVTVLQRSGGDEYRATGTIKTAPGARTSFFDPEKKQLYVAVPHRGKQAAEVMVFQTTDQ